MAQKLSREKAHIPGPVLCYTSGSDQGFSDVTIRHFCNCSVADLSIPDLCIGCRRKKKKERRRQHLARKTHTGVTHTHTHTVSDLLREIRHK